VKLASLALSLCTLAVSSLFAPAAVAETDASSRALAVQLFDDAEKLFAAGQVSAACPKYAESYRLDPQLGVLIYLAECFEKDGKLASAWGSYREATEVAQKRGDPRAAHAAERAKAIEPRLSYLLIEVPAASRVNGLELTRDGAAVSQVLWGARAAIDAGTHRIEAHAPGYVSWHADVTISKEGSAETVNVPALVADAGKGGAGAATGANGALPGTSQRIAALAVGGLGLAAIGVGGFFGLSAQSSYSDSKDFCSEANFCTPRGNDLRHDAKNKATIATIASGVGLAAVVTAGVLWFTAPRVDKASRHDASRRRYAWSVAPTSSSFGLEVSGAF
jgi:hypothetical protein